MKYTFDRKVFITRVEGQQIREQLEALLRQAAANNEPLVLNFTKTKAMTYSFVDECLGRLISMRLAGDVPDIPLLVTGLTDDVAEEIHITLDRRNVGIVRMEGSTPQLLGGDQYLQETFARAVERGQFKATDIADDLNTTAQNVNNRLKRLVEVGALTRLKSNVSGGGREFLYRVPEPV